MEPSFRGTLPPFSLRRTLRFFFEYGELNFLFYRVDAVHEHSNPLTQAVDLSVALADDLARVFVVGVAVVDQRVQRDQSFDKQIGELDKESELGDADDQAVEVFADAILHELDLLPLHQLALGFVGAALGVAGLFGDLVKLFERDRAGDGFERFAMRRVIAAFGPWRGVPSVAGPVVSPRR